MKAKMKFRFLLLVLCGMFQSGIPQLRQLQEKDSLIQQALEIIENGQKEFESIVSKQEAEVAKFVDAETSDGSERESKDTQAMIQRFLGFTQRRSFELTRLKKIEDVGLQIVQNRLDIDNATMGEVIQGLPHGVFDCKFNIPVYCPKECCKRRYRTISGVCNNQGKPHWGESFRPMQRILPPDWCNSVLGEMRCRQNGTPLPSARAVSLALFPDMSFETDHTNLLMTFGQFIDHDIGHTAATELHSPYSGNTTAVTCGSDGCQTGGTLNAACAPIKVPTADPDFTPKPCLTFVRSLQVTDQCCTVGSRTNLNQITSYLDLSSMYGSTDAESQDLRDLSTTRGKMKTHNPAGSGKGLLPQDPLANCLDTTSTKQCFKAGDVRVNEQNGLTAMHTVWVRYHNIIEEEIHQRYGQVWSGEEKFQEARRIVTSVYQHILIHEYLPIIIGPNKVAEFGLSPAAGFYTGYDPSINADAINGFQTAAWRFGHSLVNEYLQLNEVSCAAKHQKRMSAQFFRPAELYMSSVSGTGTPIDKIIFGQALQIAENVDEYITKEITAHLFAAIAGGMGTDLVSLNIQRGRDHGLPGYNAYREFCGLPKLNYKNCDDCSFTDIPSANCTRLQALYPDPDDIDLFAGAMLENPVPGGKVGPTFACIIGKQFKSLRKGDRYWFERDDECHGFTLCQLAQIRQMTLAKVLCEAADNISHLQEWAFRKIHILPSILNVNAGPTQQELLEKILKNSFCPDPDLHNNPPRCCKKLPNMDFDVMFPKPFTEQPCDEGIGGPDLTQADGDKEIA